MAERGSLVDERNRATAEKNGGDKDGTSAATPRGGPHQGGEKAADKKSDPEPAASKAAHAHTEPPADLAPSIPPMPAAGPWRSYKEIVAAIATRIVDAQKPIRVLQAIRWDNSVEEAFLKNKGRELP
jgi:hypothetical protein